MLMEQTLEKMNQMKLSAMVEALEQQRRSNQYTDLGFEERLGLRVDEEWTAREHRKLTLRWPRFVDSLAACLRCIPVAAHLARISLDRSSCRRCCAGG